MMLAVVVAPVTVAGGNIRDGRAVAVTGWPGKMPAPIKIRIGMIESADNQKRHIEPDEHLPVVATE